MRRLRVFALVSGPGNDFRLFNVGPIEPGDFAPASALSVAASRAFSAGDGESTTASIIVSTQHRSEAVGFSEPTATLLAALAKWENSCIPACFNSLGFRL
jgi:hypothetical protein